MKKKIVAALLATLLCFSIIPNFAGAYSAEDYTTYTEVDPTSKLTETSTRVTWTAISDATVAYVYIDKGVNYISANTDYTFDFSFSPNGTAQGYENIFAVTDYIGGMTINATNHQEYVVMFNGANPNVGIGFADGLTTGGSTPISLVQDTTYYARALRSGTTLRLSIFSDSGHTTQIGVTQNQSITSNNSRAFRYLYAFQDSAQTSGYGSPSGFVQFGQRADIVVSGNPIVQTGSSSTSNGVMTLNGAVLDVGTSNVTITGFLLGPNSGNYTVNQTTNQTVSVNGTSFTENISGLTAGQVYYYKAQALNSAGWGYGSEFAFTFSGYITINHTTIITNASFPGYETFLASYNVTNWSGNVTTKGYQVGSANGTWDFVSTPLTIDYSGTAYYTTLSGFVNGTTYYFRPYIAGYDSNGNYQTFYGSVGNFTENSTAGTVSPNVTTVGAAVSAFPVNAYHNPSILYSGIVTSSVNPLVQWGFIVSNVSSQVNNTTAGGYVLSLLGSNVSPLVFVITNDVMPVGVVYFRAFAMDSHGLIGYGSTLNVTNALPSGVVSVNTTSAVVFNGATFFGTVSNPSGVLFSQYGFQWGNASNNLTNASTNTSTNPLFAFNSQFIQFDDNSTVFFRAGVRSTGGNWTWSNIDSTTVGAAGNVTLTLPVVTTHLASNTTLNSFTTTIEFTTPIGNNVTEYGIQYRFHNYGSYTTVIAGSGNFTSGNHTALFAGFMAAQTVYYHAYATNSIGTGYGNDMYVVIGSTSPNGGGAPVTGGKPTQEISDWMRGLMAGWGMDNTIGHWAFMGIVMMIVFVIFISLIIYLKVQKYGEMIIKIVALFLGVLELAIVGGFVFSGMLDALGVILLVIIGAGVLWGMISGAGKANQSRGEA